MTRQKFFIIFAALLVELLPGCESYKPKPLHPEQNAAAFDGRRLDDPALGDFARQHLTPPPVAWPPEAWDVDSLAVAAAYFQPELAVTRATWREARAGIITAKQRPNPTVGPYGGFDFNSPMGVNPWLPGLTIDLPVETAGKRSKRIAQAKDLAETGRWNLESAFWATRANVRNALIDLSAAGQRAAILERQVAAQGKLATLLENRAKAGDIAPGEASPARAMLARDQMALNDARQAIVDARAKLAAAVGIPAKNLTEIKFAPDWDAIPAGATNLISAQARATALTGRADTRAALAQYAAAEDALRLEVAKQYPDIHLTQGYQWDQGESKWTPGFSIELPVLSHNQGPIAEARARREEAEARFFAVQAQVINDIDRAVAQFQLMHENLAALESLAGAQRQQAVWTQNQFDAGAIERETFLGAQVDLATGELAELDARAKLRQTAAALEDAVQPPSPYHLDLTRAPNHRTPRTDHE